ncbi:BQ2448_313 [Microbotryum intermedium]|uniref:RNA polymerase II-associated protein 3 n=1 Tax=Microbotryum intermedium TaxID=269621 RepID=A0A238F238_9BASI|nr:BQ2448_313 [Microbotryum intermedium]
MSKAAEASKDKGNLAFRQANYPLALAHYTTSIQLDPSCYLYPLNRSLVHLKSNEFKLAEKDATVALDLDPVEGSKKAYYRRALARKGMGQYQMAIKGEWVVIVPQIDAPRSRASADVEVHPIPHLSTTTDLEQAKQAGAEPNEIDQEINAINKLLQDASAQTQHELPLPRTPIPNKPPAAPSVSFLPSAFLPSRRSDLEQLIRGETGPSQHLPKTPSMTSSVEEPTSEPRTVAQPPPSSGKSAAPSKDRLRAALAPQVPTPSPSTHKESASIPASQSKTTNSNTSRDLMTAVSTRSLTRPTTGQGKAPSSFAAKKHERTSRFASSAPVKASKSAPKLDSKSLPPPPPPTETTTTLSPPAAAAAAAAVVAPTPPPVASPPKPPTTISAIPAVPKGTATPPSIPFQPTTPTLQPMLSNTPSNHPTSSTFEQALCSPSLSPSERLVYLRSIPPSTLPTLLKGGALTPDLLILIIQALSACTSSSTEPDPEPDLDEWLLRLLDHLPDVERFDLNVMFLGEGEKDLVKGVFERAEKALRRSRGKWGV